MSSTLTDLFAHLDKLAQTEPEAAVRATRALFSARDPLEGARDFRRRSILLMAAFSDANTQRESLPESALRQQRDAADKRARDYLEDLGRFASADRVTPERAERVERAARAALKAAEIRLQTQRARPELIFISYRRGDSAEMTGFIAQRLQSHFGADSIFMDVDSIPFGVNFRAHIVATLSKCRACLVIIGPDWVDAANKDGARRLDEPDDLVRVEVETALGIGVPVAPILVRGAQVPTQAQLPPSIAELAMRNGQVMRAHPDFDHDIMRLISRLTEQLGQ